MRCLRLYPSAWLFLAWTAALLVPNRGLATDSPWPVYPLEPDAAWQLNLPDGQPFEASALTFTPDGALLTVSDRSPTVYRILLPETPGAADLVPDPHAFPADQLRQVAPTPTGRYDCEGLAFDPQGRLYLCEEAQRWILRWDPHQHRVERLQIDWSPVQHFFSPWDRNASFEGIAIGNQRLYVANERQQGRIIEVDLESLEVLDSFEVRTHRNRPWDAHYSGLSWHNDRLYVLCRESRAVLQVDPRHRTVQAEYDFASIERNPEWRYQVRLPLVGIMEGLAVDDRHIWLVTDNNHMPRERYPDDRRPTLFRCPRPDRPRRPRPRNRRCAYHASNAPTAPYSGRVAASSRTYWSSGNNQRSAGASPSWRA